MPAKYIAADLAAKEDAADTDTARDRELIRTLSRKRIIRARAKGYVFFAQEKNNFYRNTPLDVLSKHSPGLALAIGNPVIARHTALKKNYLEKYGALCRHPVMVYINYPFCRNKCRFCHYQTVSLSPAAMESTCRAYIKALKKETDAMFGDDESSFDVSLLAIGGGTPLYIGEPALKDLLGILEGKLLSGATVRSIETSPLELCQENSERKLTLLREHGFDRISLGVQGMDDDLLNAIGARNSRASLSHKSARVIRRFGFRHFNVDIMWGFGLTRERAMIRRAEEFITEFLPESVSLYRFSNAGSGGKRTTFDAAQSFAVLRAYDDMLKNKGYEKFGRHYTKKDPEVRAKEAAIERWLVYGGDCLGVGANARSFVGDLACRNIAGPAAYTQMMMRQKSSAVVRTDFLSKRQHMKKYLAYNILKENGIRKTDFKTAFNRRFDQEFGGAVEILKSLDVVADEPDRIRIKQNCAIFDQEVLKILLA